MQFCARFVRPRLFVVPVLLAALAPALPAVAQDVPGDFGMFLPVDAAGSEVVGLAARRLAEDPLVVRARRVGIDFEAFAPLTAVLERGAALPVLRLNLFENVVVESLVESVDLTASVYSWSGGVAGDPMGSVAVTGDRGNVVPGVAERLLVVGWGAVVGAVPGIERAGSGVDLFQAPFVAGIVLLPGVRFVHVGRDVDREQLLRDGDGRSRRCRSAVLNVALGILGAGGCGGHDRGGRAQPRDDWRECW